MAISQFQSSAFREKRMSGRETSCFPWLLTLKENENYTFQIKWASSKVHTTTSSIRNLHSYGALLSPTPDSGGFCPPKRAYYIILGLFLNRQISQTFYHNSFRKKTRRGDGYSPISLTLKKAPEVLISDPTTPSKVYTTIFSIKILYTLGEKLTTLALSAVGSGLSPSKA